MRPPTAQFLVEVFQPPEFIIEQRADPGEPGRRPDPGIEPREIRVRYHEFGKEFVTADQSPYRVGIAHGTILPSARSAAPIRASGVKRAYGPGPVTTRAAGLG